MNNQRKMSFSTGILSITLMMFFVASSVDVASFDVFALKGEGVPNRSYGSNSDVCGDKLCSEISSDMKSVSSKSMKSDDVMKKSSDDSSMMNVAENPSVNKTYDDVMFNTEIQQMQGVSLEFSSPEIILAKTLVPINARIFNSIENANLSHTDWAYTITNSQGDTIYKTTTLHGHFGIMNFKNYFPSSGTYTISYTTLSSGPFMLGASVPELGQTRSVITGDLLRFEEDPKANFGSRTFEFTVDVIEPEQSVVVKGSEPDAAYFVKLTTIPERVVVGEPVTIVFDVDDYYTGNDATHVDGLISVIPQHYYQSDYGDQPEAPIPIPLAGAFHGHLGSLSVTQIFDKSGTVILEVDLSTIPYSVPAFGQASVDFTIQVFDTPDSSDTVIGKTNADTVDIVGLASPFYMPNAVKVSSGNVLTFDNVDGNHHTVTSVHSGTLQHNDKFDSGILGPGDKFEVTLDEKGTYDYFCALHAGMTGIIIVE